MLIHTLLILLGVSAAASADSFSAVLAYSAAGIRIPARSMCTIGLVSGGILGLSVMAGSSLTRFGSSLTAAGAVLLVLLGALKLAGSWLKSLAGRLARRGRPYTFSAWNLRFMLEVYADPTRADADRSGTLTVREAAVLAAVLSADGAVTGLGTGPGLAWAWLALPVGIGCSLLAAASGWAAGRFLRGRCRFPADRAGAAVLILLGLARLAGQAT